MNWLAATSAITAAGGAMAYAVRGRSATILAPSVWHGDRNRQSLALTFDDGPSESTPRVLEILARHNARATFFMCGANAARLPAIAAEVARAGHQIGNHSNTHPRFDFCSQQFIYKEIAQAQENIAAATGITPKVFRAPYGVRWFGMGQAQKRAHLSGVMWSVLARDWRLTAPQVASRIREKARAGDIICLHDGRITQAQPDVSATLSALESVLPALAANGFRFATVDEILCPTPSASK